jgi:hypothetical protein
MDTGVAIFPTHDAIAPAEVARPAEERGHESLFFPEHTHIPASPGVLERVLAFGDARFPSHAPTGILDRYETAIAEMYGE